MGGEPQNNPPKMLCGDAGWAAGLVCIMVLGAMGHPAGEDTSTVIPPKQDNMSKTWYSTDAAKHHVRRSQSLSAGEQGFILRRKQIVLKSLNKLGVTCSQYSVPHIAVLGSGGGQRAIVSLVGSLYQMKKEGLLDAVLYLGGVSGSAMSMGSLYSDPQWNANMDATVSRLSGPKVELSEVMDWLDRRVKEEHFSLSDIWGALTSAAIMKQLDKRRLSEDGGYIMNPYPIYNAVNKNCLTNGSQKSKWFEITPHESGFTELGLFINTAYLGSRTPNVEKDESPEMDLVRLQGIMGSMLACEEDVGKYMFDWLRVQQRLSTYEDCDMPFCRPVWYLTELIRKNTKNFSGLEFLDKLQKTLKERLKVNPTETFEKKCTEQPVLKQWLQRLMPSLQKWTQSPDEGPSKNNATLLINKLISLIVNWEWGTTENFLYQDSDPTVPACIRLKERLQLIDAGVMLNIPFAPFLGEKRDTDLLIVLDYGGADTFEDLLTARDYATKLNKPFPEIEEKVLEEKDWPRDIYVFRGEAKEPTIVYMPLFNRENCRDAEELRAKREEFTTLQPSYSKEKIHALLEIAKANIKNSQDTLLREVKTAALRRPFRRHSGHTV
ncbi:cytosolic phospholipase A2 gamma-like [Parambassis ranga]|uniref:Cytosolic phospholipase A2 gamma-like n=1 Tax=Parambassis ranga TaxID=210632 RepID=A0A6P7I1Y9_9TELE|nr:cytosolic phospholipase A2 gamma-like [Parambassis ranga]